MRSLKIFGFVVACIAPVVLLVLLSSVFGPDDIHAPPAVAIPSEERPVAEEDIPMNAPESEVRREFDVEGLNGEVVFDSEGRPRIVWGNDRPSDRYYLREGSSFESSRDLSYNPELRRMKLHIDDNGDVRHGSKEHPGEKSDWETLKRRQRGEEAPTAH